MKVLFFFHLKTLLKIHILLSNLFYFHRRKNNIDTFYELLKNLFEHFFVMNFKKLTIWKSRYRRA